MCSPAACKKCGKTTWSGCGAHVEQVMSKVPVPQRCVCDSAPTSAATAGPSRGRRWGIFRQ